MVTAEEFKEVLQEKNYRFSQNPETKRISIMDILDNGETVEVCVDFFEDDIIVVSIPICDYEEPDKQELAMQLIQALNNTSLEGKYIMLDGTVWLLGYIYSLMASSEDIKNMLCRLCVILDGGDYAKFMKIKWS